jgi:hypothetical protein
MINDLERRAIANLSIPRNATSLYLRLVSDEHTPVGPGAPPTLQAAGLALETEAEVDKYLREHLEPQGLVTKIDPTEDHAALAANPPKDNYGWHEESRENWARVMELPQEQWQGRGDRWILSRAGMEMINEPTGPSPDMTIVQLQAAIDRTHARWKDGELLDDEYKFWMDGVLDYYDHRRDQLRLPMVGGASGFGDVFSSTVINLENQKTTAPALVDPWFLALSKIAITRTDTGTTIDGAGYIPVYTTYARKSVAASLMSTATAGSSTNSGGAITFVDFTAGSAQVIIAVANTSASTVGILRKWGDVASTTLSTTQTPATIATSAYVTTAT